MNTVERIAKLKALLAHDGVRAALIFLNSLTTHRFTALYRFDGDMLKNLYFYDREHPEIDSSDEVPILASYCVFVRQSGQRFDVTDSLRDERVCGHPKRMQVQSYCGVPLMDENGEMFGTMCHFDVRPMPITSANIELMEALAPLLKERERLIPSSTGG